MKSRSEVRRSRKRFISIERKKWGGGGGGKIEAIYFPGVCDLIATLQNYTLLGYFFNIKLYLFILTLNSVSVLN